MAMNQCIKINMHSKNNNRVHQNNNSNRITASASRYSGDGKYRKSLKNTA
jgi:hypothetical protein